VYKDAGEGRVQGARSVLVNNDAAKLPNFTPHFCNDEDRESPVFEAPLGVSLSIMHPNTAFSNLL